MTNLSIPKPQFLSNLERREIARAEMATWQGDGKLMYLFHSLHIRHIPISDKLTYHSAIDVINVLWDMKHEDAIKKGVDFEPRQVWNNVKKRLLRDDPGLSEFLGQASFSLWNNPKRLARGSDTLTSGGVVGLIFELHSPLSNEIRHAIMRLFERYPRQYYDTIIAEMERDYSWAGTRNHLEIAPHVEPDTYEKPVQPPGNPPEVPTLWRPKP